MPFDDIVRITVFVKNLADAEAVNQVYTTFFPDSAIARAVGYFPARTVVAAKPCRWKPGADRSRGLPR